MQKKIDFVPMKTFREELLAVKLWFGLTCVFVKHRVQQSAVSPWREAGVTTGEKNPLSAQWNGLTDSSSKAGGKKKNQHRWKPRTVLQPHICWNLISDELCCVSFADEDFQQSQLGFDMLVLAVLCRQWGAVLLLHVSKGTRQQTVRRVER